MARGPKGLDRREVLALGALGGAGFALGCGDNVVPETECLLTREQTAGPFYFDPELERRAIDEGRAGIPLTIALQVVLATDCAPLASAVVDLWHSDGGGLYSGYPGQGDNRDIDTTGEFFCRGIQITGADGGVTFTTIFPGWYPGRTVHCHYQIDGVVAGGAIRSPGQLYFPDSLSREVLADPVYLDRGPPATTNASDAIAGDPRADGTLATITREGSGYRASLTIGVAADG